MSKTLSAVRNGTIKFPKSRAGAERQYYTLLNAYRKAYAGGGAYGFDWRTMRAQERELYDYLQQLASFKPLAAELPKTYQLFWSPEGKCIATVQARDMRSAIRKAPKPYSKFKGEIYALEVQS